MDEATKQYIHDIEMENEKLRYYAEMHERMEQQVAFCEACKKELSAKNEYLEKANVFNLSDGYIMKILERRSTSRHNNFVYNINPGDFKE